MENNWVLGIDVSKAWLDCHAVKDGEKAKEASFQNDDNGIRKLVRFAQSLGELDWIGMESTGGYEQDLALAAFRAGLKVSVLNPRRVKDFARAKGTRNKTDRVDARIIAGYLRKMDPTPWQPDEHYIQELKSFTRQNRTLLAEVNRYENQLQSKGLTPMHARQIAQRLALARQHLKENDEARARLVEENQALFADVQALTKIKGIAHKTACAILAEAGDIESYPNAQSFAASAGLNPCRRESGQFRGRSTISKSGNVHLRTALYVPSSVAGRFNPQIREFKERLLKAGKTKMQVRIACMRKLLMICYGILIAIRKGKTPYYGQKPALT